MSTTQLTTVIGVSEFAGLSTLAVGDHLDRGRERLVMVTSLGLVSISSVIALGGSLTTFAVAFVVLVLGVSNYTVAGHTWISHRVAYRWRARSFGVFEMSWALALLLGAPDRGRADQPVRLAGTVRGAGRRRRDRRRSSSPGSCRTTGPDHRRPTDRRPAGTSIRTVR